MTEQETARPVRKRQVFYIPGYDPIHPRRYRELYRKESADQAEISGYRLSLSPTSGARYGWQIEAEIDGAKVDTKVEVLVWSDIVRDSMENTIPATYLQIVRTAWTYLASGALFRLMFLRKGPIIAALYPVGMLLLQLVIALLIGAFCTWAFQALSVFIARLMIPIPELVDAYRPVFFLLSVPLFPMAAIAVLRWFKSKDNRFFAYYLMHDYAYSAQWNGANPPELEARMTIFRGAILEALASDVDEVLVVGHSSGAHLAVSILADILRAGAVREAGPALGFLSLGQVVPMVSFLRDAGRLRADLRKLSEQDIVAWVDVTAPGDGCAFALCDPVSVSGVAREDKKKWPLVISAAFTQSLSPERWSELRWRFFRLHFQYLCAFDRPKDYDYFQITAGPKTLAERFKDRPPSKSRIERPLNRYTSVNT